jgi:hypothetical protein
VLSIVRSIVRAFVRSLLVADVHMKSWNCIVHRWSLLRRHWFAESLVVGSFDCSCVARSYVCSLVTFVFIFLFGFGLWSASYSWLHVWKKRNWKYTFKIQLEPI